MQYAPLAIIGAGAMGSRVAQRAIARGVTVLSPLDGRSAVSRRRAERAGMVAASTSAILDCSYLLSIVPPAQARKVIEDLLPWLAQANRKPVVVDCNALDPGSISEMAELLAPTGARFIDAGIIGGPGAADGPGPRFHLSGETPEDVVALRACGIDAIGTGQPAGAASALKMAYAGINKGLIGLSAAMILAAERTGAGDALRRELVDSQAPLMAKLAHALPDMFPKAYRWDFEMQEIARFGADLDGVPEIYEGLARLYARLAADQAAGQDDIRAILRFLDGPPAKD